MAHSVYAVVTVRAQSAALTIKSASQTLSKFIMKIIMQSEIPSANCFLAADVDDFFMLPVCDDFCFLNKLSTVPAFPKMSNIIKFNKSDDM